MRHPGVPLEPIYKFCRPPWTFAEAVDVFSKKVMQTTENAIITTGLQSFLRNPSYYSWPQLYTEVQACIAGSQDPNKGTVALFGQAALDAAYRKGAEDSEQRQKQAFAAQS
jgi:hypothetical protein